ncbi:glycogen synthase GlgA [Vibrio sp. SS-MA-C1-2]|uniref:glycogen synthase GlgA n=1 Tax=Vibrio sp. SS-MA-C1-2 TaxID=2908646 RepID=UPI001F3339FA|nr:glycogen synthase GlgA [Vibrio sp. SS-MA-C1-2]UJF16839.1 glycogen synthase GlgA [Vibrio sp. SS-MA-C1-2]
MASKQLKILFIASEVEGLAKTGGLADVAKSLPQALIEQGHDVRVVMPFYRSIKNREQAKLVKACTLPSFSGSPEQDYNLMEMQLDQTLVYGIDASQYYDRKELYAENNQAYQDNGERFAFFSAAALDCAEQIGFKPDIVHCNDWHTGLVPYLLKYRYQDSAFYQNSKSVITIHNAVFQGIYSYYELKFIPELLANFNLQFEQHIDYVNFLKAGVLCADKINAVSPTYAEELTSYLGAHGLSDQFASRRDDLSGIINGCDYGDWNPELDKDIPQKYRANLNSMVRGKNACKKALQAEVGLPVGDIPIYGMVCRLTEQKGIHFLLPILTEFLKNQVQVVIVGTGDPVLAKELHAIAAQYPNKLAFVEAYNNRLAHWVEAGSDFFMMPSLFEPCGLNQLYSMVYGTLPIVRAVGGLADTVIDFDNEPEEATGFSFLTPEPMTLLVTLQRSLLFYIQEKNEFRQVQLRAMGKKFLWSDVAKEYHALYKQLV